MTRLWLWTVTPSTVFSVLCHFVILYMVSIEIVSFCRVISLWNFQYRNHVHSITLMSFLIISQNLVQYKVWLDDVQRLRTVTLLDVSAVAGHHAMPASLLFYHWNGSIYQNGQTRAYLPDRTKLYGPCVVAIIGYEFWITTAMLNTRTKPITSQTYTPLSQTRPPYPTQHHWLGAHTCPVVRRCVVDASLSHFVGKWLFLCFKIIKGGSFNLALIVRQA